jgi:hypothetical protein
MRDHHRCNTLNAYPNPALFIVDDAIVFAMKEADDFGATTFDESAFIKTEEVWVRGGQGNTVPTVPSWIMGSQRIVFDPSKMTM